MGKRKKKVSLIFGFELHFLTIGRSFELVFPLGTSTHGFTLWTPSLLFSLTSSSEKFFVGTKFLTSAPSQSLYYDQNHENVTLGRFILILPQNAQLTLFHAHFSAEFAAFKNL